MEYINRDNEVNELEAQVLELSHVNEGETGFNPTPAEMKALFEAIKAEIEKLGDDI
jgi:hypothetical protein